jgi:hypothetical protein
MSSESDCSSFCSTCSESHKESNGSCLSDESSLNDSDIEWTQHLVNHSNEDLFYLKLLDKNPKLNESQTHNNSHQLSNSNDNKLNTNDR